MPPSQNPAPQDLSLFTKSNKNVIGIENDVIVSYKNINNPSYSDFIGTNDVKKLGNNNNNNLKFGAAKQSGNLSEISFQDMTAFGDPPVSNNNPENSAQFEKKNNKLDGSNDSVGSGSTDSLTQKVDPGRVKKSRTGDKVFENNLSREPITITPNPLNGFASYTYNIALYMMNAKNYVNLVQLVPNNPSIVLNDSQLLMRSGGVADEGGNNFADDFYIDNVDLYTVATGPDAFAMNTNVTDITFTIVEPRGVTLLERLQKTAASVLNEGERYVNAPYLLEITFKGYDDNGTPVPFKQKPKYVPIRISQISFEVTAMGTEYSVEAVPFAHQAFDDINATIPINIQIKASTIGDILNGKNVSVSEFVSVPESRLDEDDPVDVEIAQKGGYYRFANTSKDLGEILTLFYKRKTEPSFKYTNSNFADFTTGGVTFANDAGASAKSLPTAEKYNSYKFRVASDIANAKINVKELYDALHTPVPDNTQENQFNAFTKSIASTVGIDKERGVFTINAGTDIVKLINVLIMHSDYMDRNVDEGVAGSNKPIDWFKITPLITEASGEGKGWDRLEGRNKYSYEYNITPYRVDYHDFPWGPKNIPTGDGVHKRYNYIFSGENIDVLDFKLKFDDAFHQVMTMGIGTPAGGNNLKLPTDNFVTKIKQVPNSIEGDTTNPRIDLTRARGKDLFSSVMRDGTDLVELNLTIVGDPSYITTSDYYWQDRYKTNKMYSEAYMPDGTINYQVSKPYIEVNFRTPTDYNEISGLANPKVETNSSFSGTYTVFGVKSSFAGGLFQQVLECNRSNLTIGANRSLSSPPRRMGGNQIIGKEIAINERDLVKFNNQSVTSETSWISGSESVSITNTVAPKLKKDSSISDANVIGPKNNSRFDYDDPDYIGP